MDNSKRVEVTTRKYECLKLVAMGYTLEEVAARLCISRRMVVMHLSILRAKMGAKSTPHLVALFYEHGLFRPRGPAG